MKIQDRILKFLETKFDKGACTEVIADEFNLTNRQVGSIMAKLKQKGFVITYTKGTIVFTDFMTRKAVPTRLSNSFYAL